MSAPSDAFAWHLAQLGEHSCCWITDGVECGLLCGHQGDHSPYVPGGYLFVPPQLPPLGMLRLRLAHWPWPPCPVCSVRLDEPPHRSAVGLHVWQYEDQFTVEHTGACWQFWPCGCECREVIA